MIYFVPELFLTKVLLARKLRVQAKETFYVSRLNQSIYQKTIFLHYLIRSQRHKTFFNKILNNRKKFDK